MSPNLISDENQPQEPVKKVVQEIDALREQVRLQLPTWVNALVGCSFENAEEAKRTIEGISNLARLCGYRICYKGKPVSMCVSMGSRQQCPSIALFQGKNYVKTDVSSKQIVPPVTVETID